MIKGLILAFQFLTSLKINYVVDYNKENFKNAQFFFPFVGLFIGIVSSIGMFIINKNITISIITLILYLLLTGAMHFDGIADIFDGIGSGKTGDDMVKIMRDPHIGTFGVIAVFMILISKIALYHELYNPLLIAISCANSRFVSVHLMNHFKTSSSGMASFQHSSKVDKAELLILLLHLTIITLIYRYSIIAFLISLLSGRFLAKIMQKRAGYVSGDCYGASVEIGEIASLLCLWVIEWISFL